METENQPQTDSKEIYEAAKSLSKEGIKEMVGLLSEKDDAVRYRALLILEARSEMSDDVYAYREEFREKLKSGNSFQRNIGLRMIACNARRDDGWLDGVLDEYLSLLYDEKPITIRQCVQYLNKIAEYWPQYNERITGALTALDLSGIRETMRKLVQSDILEVLSRIRKSGTNEEIEEYVSQALLSGIFDNKTRKYMEELFSR
jgi:hypothetical protein